MNSGIISIIGRPNVGKSTLLNRIVGEKIAAVSSRPQTTRNRIMGIHTAEPGQIVFLDTPGIHKPHNKMHQRMVDLALGHLRGVDAILLVVDASTEFGKGDEFVIQQLGENGLPIVLGLNKIDLIKKSMLLPLMESYGEKINPKAIVPFSALNGEGVTDLVSEIFGVLPESEPLYPTDLLTDQTERQFVAEIIREKVFRNTRQEIPFSTAVFIDAFEEEEHMLHIAASIVVEKSGQKGIVIGKGGSMLKKIGTEARLELEKILATKMYLDLHVKVRTDWREDDRTLRELGLT